jgi:chromosome segregation protein
MAEHEARREAQVTRRDALRAQLQEARQRAAGDRDRVHQLALETRSLHTQVDSTRRGLERMETQLEGLAERREALLRQLTECESPITALNRELEQLLDRRLQVEKELSAARAGLEGIEHQLRELESSRGGTDQRVAEVRAELEQARMRWQELKVRRQTLEEQVIQGGFEVQPLLEELPETAAEAEWEQSLEQVNNRIQRLGPINLAAIDEYKVQSERKTYLDSQHADLTEALETLENAIRRIDRETRTRFRETFDKVNDGLKQMFPRLFGGGHAYLELTGEDVLDAGVSIMARPPGKRNSTIHLLSGGEKALTAVALVFSIFELNPAPFCMLDEVDAPLDDANVGRFCTMVKEMSERVQFVFITHNKTTMEMAQHLSGVTMQEPGVSRLVSVDVQEAVALAAS